MPENKRYKKSEMKTKPLTKKEVNEYERKNGLTFDQRINLESRRDIKKILGAQGKMLEKIAQAEKERTELFKIHRECKARISFETGDNLLKGAAKIKVAGGILVAIILAAIALVSNLWRF